MHQFELIGVFAASCIVLSTMIGQACIGAYIYRKHGI